VITVAITVVPAAIFFTAIRSRVRSSHSFSHVFCEELWNLCKIFRCVLSSVRSCHFKMRRSSPRFCNAKPMRNRIPNNGSPLFFQALTKTLIREVEYLQTGAKRNAAVAGSEDPPHKFYSPGPPYRVAPNPVRAMS
jgi:hypothetical protein